MMTTMTSSFMLMMLAAVSLLATLINANVVDAFSVVAVTPRTVTREAAALSRLQVTKKQKEQLDKYGATPETSIEILFDKMADTPEFMLKVLPKPWQSLVKDMKQMKADKQKKELEKTTLAEKKKVDDESHRTNDVPDGQNAGENDDDSPTLWTP
jgi:hypothetical protein